MKRTIELEQDVGYKYSLKSKNLIYWPNWEDHLLNERYKKELLKLHNTLGCEQKVQFVELKSQLIQNAIGMSNQLVFEVTEKCNLSCAYCGLGETYHKVSEDRCQNMEWKTAKTVLDFYIKTWQKERPKKFKRLCRIDFYGGGAISKYAVNKKYN
ncbi:MAG: hypothetical protein Q8T08_25215 [Ignavibacteria bacterium]|nr:hypothetical protein [Ignavibacteria bacterium]